jgi:hypothetical protein
MFEKAKGKTAKTFRFQAYLTVIDVAFKKYILWISTFMPTTLK